ncbi:MAG: hypothetical protein KBC64_04550 [Simkaniaceae bacterium]|nr:hypothetical protein [Simkaniaceae bacterium]
MLPVKCLSSRCTSEVLAWRNPPALRPPRAGEQVAKMVVAEVALFGLNALAVIETVAYAALQLISKLFLSYTTRPHDLFNKLLQSSAFTWAWTGVDLILNPKTAHVSILFQESQVRQYVQMFMPPQFPVIFRPEDQRDLQRIAAAPAPAPVPAAPAAPALDPIDQAGVDFLFDRVYSRLTPASKTLFTQMDPRIFELVAAKTVMIHVFARNGMGLPLPPYLKQETKDAIDALRLQFPGGGLSSRPFWNLFKDCDAFEQGPVDQTERLIWQQIKDAAGNELQGSRLLTTCYQAVIPLTT